MQAKASVNGFFYAISLVIIIWHHSTIWQACRAPGSTTSRMASSTTTPRDTWCRSEPTSAASPSTGRASSAGRSVPSSHRGHLFISSDQLYRLSDHLSAHLFRLSAHLPAHLSAHLFRLSAHLSAHLSAYLLWLSAHQPAHLFRLSAHLSANPSANQAAHLFRLSAHLFRLSAHLLWLSAHLSAHLFRLVLRSPSSH